MAELLSITQLIDQIVRNLVDSPDEITIKEDSGERSTSITIIVKKDDVGKIIGREGRMIGAIRTVCENIASKHKKRITISVID